MSFVSFLSQLIKAQSVQHIKYSMDKDEFNRRVLPLLKWNKKQERYYLAKTTETRACTYCDKNVANQVITCDAHRLGTPLQHFKHKCKVCNCYVFDGSVKIDPYKIRSTFYYYTKVERKTNPTNPKLSINGKLLGRPPKPKLREESKRRVGRPRKDPTL